MIPNFDPLYPPKFKSHVDLFCKDLVTEYCLYLVKKMIPNFDPLYLPKFKSHVDLFLQGLSNRVLSVPGKENDSQL